MNGQALSSRAFVLSIREGQVDEYRRRHDAIWPEMVAALIGSGIVHYDIFLDAGARRVFGHMLVRADAEGTDAPVILRWRAYMADVLEMDGDAPARAPIEKVFHLAAWPDGYRAGAAAARADARED